MEEQIKTAPQTDVEVVDIQFRSGQKIYFSTPTASASPTAITSSSTPPGVRNSASAWAGITKSRRRMW